MSNNHNLNRARKEKNDEFYTRLEDIERELQHYETQFVGKRVFCNCDHPFKSNFVKFFIQNFRKLELQSLTTANYATEIPGLEKEIAYHATITQVPDHFNQNVTSELSEDRIRQLLELEGNRLSTLKADGDFRSVESIELLKQADIVVTNPPFSLFREYIDQLMEYEKKFLVIGSMNAITYKEIFPLLKEDKLWLGCTSPKEFVIPDDESFKRKNVYINEQGKRVAKLGNILWFTNLDIEKRHEEMTLWRKYAEEEYPKYDNYDAIEVSRVKNIPCDYEGIMGVPITFMNQYNPDQFEILGMTKTPICFSNDEAAKRTKTYDNVMQYKNGVAQGSGSRVNGSSAILIQNPIQDKVCYKAEGLKGVLVAQYVRILIRNKHPEKKG